MRGLPGSGKTTKVGSIVTQIKSYIGDESFTANVFAADDYFMTSRGYKYDKTKLSRAHTQCYGRAQRCVLNNQSPIFIDNTNTTKQEMRRYYELAYYNWYKFYVIEPDTAWAFNMDVLTEKNIHGVRKYTMKNMIMKYFIPENFESGDKCEDDSSFYFTGPNSGDGELSPRRHGSHQYYETGGQSYPRAYQSNQYYESVKQSSPKRHQSNQYDKHGEEIEESRSRAYQTNQYYEPLNQRYRENRRDRHSPTEWKNTDKYRFETNFESQRCSRDGESYGRHTRRSPRKNGSARSPQYERSFRSPPYDEPNTRSRSKEIDEKKQLEDRNQENKSMDEADGANRSDKSDDQANRESVDQLDNHTESVHEGSKKFIMAHDERIKERMKKQLNYFFKHKQEPGSSTSCATQRTHSEGTVQKYFQDSDEESDGSNPRESNEPSKIRHEDDRVRKTYDMKEKKSIKIKLGEVRAQNVTPSTPLESTNETLIDSVTDNINAKPVTSLQDYVKSAEAERHINPKCSPKSTPDEMETESKTRENVSANDSTTSKHDIEEDSPSNRVETNETNAENTEPTADPEDESEAEEGELSKNSGEEDVDKVEEEPPEPEPEEDEVEDGEILDNEDDTKSQGSVETIDDDIEMVFAAEKKADPKRDMEKVRLRKQLMAIEEKIKAARRAKRRTRSSSTSSSGSSGSTSSSRSRSSSSGSSSS